MSELNQMQLATDLRTVVTRLIKRLRAESTLGNELSLTGRSTLALIQQQGKASPAELAAMEKITNQSMSAVLQHLASLGYIERTTSKEDKRKQVISISKAGEKKLQQVRSLRDEWLSRAMRDTCTARELKALAKAVAALGRIVDYE